MDFIIARQEAMCDGPGQFSRWWYDKSIDEVVGAILEKSYHPPAIVSARTTLKAHQQSHQSKPIKDFFEVDEKLFTDFYQTFCQQILWLQLSQKYEFTNNSDEGWEAYKDVNQRFADIIAQRSSINGVVWIIDFPLMLVTDYLKKQRPDLQIFYYHHYHFPYSEEENRIAKWNHLLASIAQADEILVPKGIINRPVQMLRKNRIQMKCISNFIAEISPNSTGKPYKTPKYSNMISEQFPFDFETLNQKARDKKIVVAITSYDQLWGLDALFHSLASFLEKKIESQKYLVVILCERHHPMVLHEKLFKRKIDQLAGRVMGLYSQKGESTILYSSRNSNSTLREKILSICDIYIDLQLPNAFYPYSNEILRRKKGFNFKTIISKFNPNRDSCASADYIVDPYFPKEVASCLRDAICNCEKKQLAQPAHHHQPAS